VAVRFQEKDGRTIASRRSRFEEIPGSDKVLVFHEKGETPDEGFVAMAEFPEKGVPIPLDDHMGHLDPQSQETQGEEQKNQKKYGSSPFSPGDFPRTGGSAIFPGSVQEV